MSKGLILEGGAMRSIFTAGVLDSMIDQNIWIDEIYTMSAGAYAALNYISGQKGRVVETNIRTLESGDDYLGVKTFFKTGGNLFNMDKLFDEYPNKKIPFDYDKFYSSTIKLITAVTDCKTGQAKYYSEYGEPSRLMKIMRASNSLPFISRLVKLDGSDMVDGGMADPIPLYKAIESGVEKPVVVLTQLKEFRKKSTSKYGTLIRMIYWKYPKFRALLKNRPQRYNEVLDFIEEQEKLGKVFVIRPKLPPVKNNSKDTKALMDFYHHGYEMLKECAEELKAFLKD